MTAVDGTADELLIRFLEEGAPLSMASRASGVPIRTLAHLPLTREPKAPTEDELGQLSGQVARKGLDTLMDMMESGTPAIKLRAATAVAGFPLRRMSTDTSEQITEMKDMLTRTLQGQLPEDDETIEEDVSA